MATAALREPSRAAGCGDMRGPVALAALLVVLLAAACSGGSGAEEHYDRAVALSEEGQWDEAIVEYDRAIELDADYTARVP